MSENINSLLYTGTKAPQSSRARVARTNAHPVAHAHAHARTIRLSPPTLKSETPTPRGQVVRRSTNNTTKQYQEATPCSSSSSSSNQSWEQRQRARSPFHWLGRSTPNSPAGRAPRYSRSRIRERTHTNGTARESQQHTHTNTHTQPAAHPPGRMHACIPEKI